MRRGVYTLTSIKPGRFKGLEVVGSPDNRSPEVEDLHVEHLPLNKAGTSDSMMPKPTASLTLGSLTIEVHRGRQQ
jgi:hypothetical protein